jgi:hypothetical protein
MRQPHKHQFVPRWVILIYLASVLEAIGLSIYFRVQLTDPEMAIMEPLYAETQQAHSGPDARQPACDQCQLLARSPHQAALKRR